MPAQARCQHRGVEGIAERLGAEPVQKRLRIELAALDDFHRAEAARVVEGDDGAGGHMKHDVIVRLMFGAFVIVATDGVFVGPVARVAKNVKRAGHAEMHQQHVAGRKIGQQIFRPPAQAGHRLAVQALREILRQRPAQIAAVNLDFGEARAFHRGFQTAAHRLDFG